MVLAMIFAKGEDLTAGKGTLIYIDSVREIESMGFSVVIVQ